MIAHLAATLDAARALAGDHEVEITRRDPEVSDWSIAQRLEHTARALRGCGAAAAHIRAGNGVVGVIEPSLLARSILNGRRIPRGSERAPERTLPGPDPECGTIERLFDAAEAQIGELAAWVPESELAKGCIPQHDLGTMDTRQWLEFGKTHSRHHLRIIDEILVRSVVPRERES